ISKWCIDHRHLRPIISTLASAGERALRAPLECTRVRPMKRALRRVAVALLTGLAAPVLTSCGDSNQLPLVMGVPDAHVPDALVPDALVSDAQSMTVTDAADSGMCVPPAPEAFANCRCNVPDDIWPAPCVHNGRKRSVAKGNCLVDVA